MSALTGLDVHVELLTKRKSCINESGGEPNMHARPTCIGVTRLHLEEDAGKSLRNGR